jgi:16S rRNA (uracil1498-N3)-methyltransferase
LGGERVEITGDAHRHLFRARRLERGQKLRVVDGAGRARFAMVEEVTRTTAQIRLLEEAPSRDPRARVELAVAAIRPDHAAWVVEKATELGVLGIRFFPCARSQRVRGVADLPRLRRVAAAALEQCGGSTLPELQAMSSFAELLELAPHRRAVWLDAAAPPSMPIWPGAEAPWLLVIGPEGGLEPQESSALEHAGARPMSLGTRTLRSETAALAGAAVVLHHVGLPGDAPAASR